MPNRVSLLITTLAAAAVLIAALPADAFAGKKKKRYQGCRRITVQSNYTVDRVSGCVRNGRRGPEVQLPSGAWIPCEFGCHYALRTQSIDFWFWIQENARR